MVICNFNNSNESEMQLSTQGKLHTVKKNVKIFSRTLPGICYMLRLKSVIANIKECLKENDN